MRIDSHQHFWQYDPAEHVWMNDQMGSLKQDYLPTDLAPLLGKNNFDGTVVVQARQCLEETKWLLDLAGEFDFIQGVVGWLDLRTEELEQQLDRFANHSKLKGVRHVVHDEPDDRFMLRSDFRRGIGWLKDFGLTYDLLLFPKHLPVARQLVEQFPDQPFVVDHISKPLIAKGQLSPWREDIAQLAQFPNVYCKLSGMVTETDWNDWQPADFEPYLDTVCEAFGPERLMIGSDWPVCTLAGDYSSVMGIVVNYVERLSPAAQQGVLGGNCARFYGLANTQ
ncbi:amidohydrolase family protein [Aeoliella sp. ICT_H6.2]|uniref:Amidohydrolase family protein n=1 Tax=Aeoliella straminimaris TaxID=2954799 RepID=A0A9X2JI79_9BACT|nr:amidohydrolase family protein [Aeoliella straminimaris]MCO6046257.1 amidohydrolase family protein [Aeoliella straminimaris]